MAGVLVPIVEGQSEEYGSAAQSARSTLGGTTLTIVRKAPARRGLARAVTEASSIVEELVPERMGEAQTDDEAEQNDTRPQFSFHPQLYNFQRTLTTITALPSRLASVLLLEEPPCAADRQASDQPSCNIRIAWDGILGRPAEPVLSRSGPSSSFSASSPSWA
jgi:hypothetical protein